MNKNCFKWLTIAVLLMQAHCLVYAQTNYVLPQISPKSPNAAEFDKYGEIPVSMTNGTANISIPLYTIKLGSLEIPVTLSYNSNGLKVDKIPSYVGMGWSINAGGVINYEQRGLQDFDINGLGLFTNLGYNSMDSLKKFLRNQMPPDRANRYLEKLTEGELDGEFDFYNYSFAGNSGSFYLDTNQKIVMIPKSNLRAANYFGGYSITDEKGNAYYFNTADKTVSSPENPETALRPSFNATASIFLSSIKTADNRTVNFGYSAAPFSYYTPTTSVSVMSNRPHAQCPASGIAHGNAYCSLDNLMLSEIIFDGGRIAFELSTDTRADIHEIASTFFVPYLKKVKIYNANNTLISEFTFNYANGNRLQLNEVVKTDVSGNPTLWQFDYYAGSGPKLFSKAKDHWGYYKGSEYTGIPTANYAQLVPGWAGNSVISPRETNLATTRVGLLQKITYPTGGSSVFNYEQNTIRFTSRSQLNTHPFLSRPYPFTVDTLFAQNTDVTDDITGSFTLSQTTQMYVNAFRVYEPLNLTESIASLYVTPGTNLLDAMGWDCGTGTCRVSGIITLSAGTYYYLLKRNRQEANEYGRAELLVGKVVDDPSFTYPVGGCRIASIVHIDSTGGKTMKRYQYVDRIDSIGYYNIPYYMAQSDISRQEYGVCSNCGLRSTISEESVRPMSGNSVEYLYVTEFTDENGSNGAITYSFTPNDNLNPGAGPYLSPFKTNWKAGLLKNKKQFRTNGTALELVQLDSTTYEALPVTDGFTRGVKAQYSNYCPQPGLGNRYYSYQIPTFYAEQFNTTSQSQSYYDGGGKITSTSENIFGSTKHTLPTEIRTTASDGSALKEKIKYSFDYDTTTITGNEAKAIRLLQRKNVLVPIEKVSIRTIAGVDQITKSILFTYKADTAAIDKVYELLLTAPAAYSGFANSTINSGNFTKDSRYDESARFTRYDQYLNVLQMQDPNDIIKSYLWDYNQQYPVCEVNGASQSEIGYTSFETSNNGNWTITGVTLDSTYAFTGRRCLNPNAGNLSKPNLISGKQYIVSYWSRSGVKTISGGTGTSKTGITTKGWTYYEHLLTTSSTTLTLTGSGLIDELRLYPAGAQMITFTYSSLIGITSQCDARNNVVYYEYDFLGRLMHKRDIDGNILQKYEYLFYSNSGLQSVWSATGVTRCKPCSQSPENITNIQEREERDTNPESVTYQQTRWVETGVNSSCVPATWQNTATPIQCKLNTNFQNTGEQEQEQKDLNPCSPTYNQIRWIVIGTNTTACPLPVACTMNVNCWGPEQKCINGNCETGVKVYSGSFGYDPGTGMYKCYYHYEFSNGTWSPNYFEWSEVMCPLEG